MKKISPLFLLLIFFFRSSYAQLIQKAVVNFDFNQYTLTARAKNQLDSLVLSTKPKMARIEKIEIAGHCDSVGNNEYNDNLSKQRGETVQQYLLAKGINGAVIKEDAGYGKRKPLNKNSSEEERSANRRVEISIYWKLEPAPKTSAMVDTARRTLDLSKVQVNGNVVLENINFSPSSHVILLKSVPALKMLLNTMLENKNLKIEIQGHVCCTNGSILDGYDEITHTNSLSAERAKAIKGYLVAHGIEEQRVETRGFAGTRPLVKENNADDQEKNRRVEIKILSK